MLTIMLQIGDQQLEELVGNSQQRVKLIKHDMIPHQKGEQRLLLVAEHSLLNESLIHGSHLAEVRMIGQMSIIAVAKTPKAKCPHEPVGAF